MSAATDPVETVRAYYERNTRVFLLGIERQTATMHRAIWAADVRDLAQAVRYINQLVGVTIAQHMQRKSLHAVRVLDAGCGVGGTLLGLAEQLPGQMRGLGISISADQVRRAQRRAAAAGVAEQCIFLEASYLDLPCQPVFDVAVAVESLIHAPDLARTLAQISAALKPGGMLLVCDDFLADQQHADFDAALVLAAFRRGWQAHGLHTRAAAVALAEEAGLRLTEQRDFTPDLRLLRLPALLAGLLLRGGMLIPAHWSFTQSLVGGLALQCALAQSVIGYRWLVFEKA